MTIAGGIGVASNQILNPLLPRISLSSIALIPECGNFEASIGSTKRLALGAYLARN